VTSSHADVERQAYRERIEVFLAGREAGGTITADALRKGVSAASLAEAAAGLARFADEAQAVVREEYRPRLACGDRCWYCCCNPNVLVSIPELVRILDHIEAAFTPEALDALRVGARLYAGQVAGRRVEDPIDESVPCPLLVDGRCSVYEIRPLVCRGFNSTDVEACRRAHATAGALVPIFAMLRDVTDGATVGAGQQLAEAGLDSSVLDLGLALNAALCSERDFAAAVVRGEANLAAAENRTYITELWDHVRETARWAGV